MSERNHCELTGIIVTLEKVAVTPGGVPRQRLWLEHRSRQLEDGHPREVQARIGLVLAGGKTALAKHLKEGQRVRVGGFLSRAGYKGEARDRLQLIVETLEPLD
ncbi:MULTISPECIES: primosomal replication protein N [Alloalcanivorax]|uniref:primosomal replication protein N n=1 Tax=Alloalcanivorax TaxID=3020832 RepID=UPI0005500260|nr:MULTISPECIES: primosomal replication protein N [Alcanivoracaceae]MBA4722364.1 primosomal replication protein N [Alcanivorax sp.]ARB44642.1 prepilin peptidase [Alloalcanivorax xenomutans]PHS63490.1 MAG: primosomal replication protein N [Alcanivorax sp.]WOA33588.1 primosomal replication protein N [Alloalcanivorax xenomutans]WOD30499.1 primosomal replication protein N [Alloalcanivorax xenomutans]